MRKITGDIDVRLPLSEVNRINEMIERDTAKAVKYDESYDLEYCPMCNGLVFKSSVFCGKCGQRLDHDNKQL